MRRHCGPNGNPKESPLKGKTPQNATLKKNMLKYGRPERSFPAHTGLFSTHPSVLVGGVGGWGTGGATARSALGWYRPSVGVPRDVGC